MNRLSSQTSSYLNDQMPTAAEFAALTDEQRMHGLSDTLTRSLALLNSAWKFLRVNYCQHPAQKKDRFSAQRFFVGWNLPTVKLKIRESLSEEIYLDFNRSGRISGCVSIAESFDFRDILASELRPVVNFNRPPVTLNISCFRSIYTS